MNSLFTYFKKLSLLAIFVSSFFPCNLIAGYSDYFDLRIGNIFVYDCTNWLAYPNCVGHFRMRIVITDTITYFNRKYSHFTRQVVQYPGSYCSFFTWMFPFNLNTYNAIRLDTNYGMIYYYNPGSGCYYSQNETLIDSLNSQLGDTVKIRCVQNPYYYICIDTNNNIKRYYINLNPVGFNEIDKEYTRYVGLTKSYRYLDSPPSGNADQELLSGSVINGVVYGDTSFATVGIHLKNSKIPFSFSLSQNYPNPFNPSTKIKFDIPLFSKEGTGVVLKIYDILGREVATLVNEKLKPGSYEYEWNGSDFASGVYFYKLTTNDFSQTKRMVLLK